MSVIMFVFFGSKRETFSGRSGGRPSLNRFWPVI